MQNFNDFIVLQIPEETLRKPNQVEKYDRKPRSYVGILIYRKWATARCERERHLVISHKVATKRQKTEIEKECIHLKPWTTFEGV